ncbi:hypothetical protein [Campylobacter helveticus]|uniref:hypothetical protein n=1 Tax=Campylobacter helveticus TaxID=28898 RepID=UPI00214A600C|nr:hypothetical protein [Campylobacter helveticus]MCR2057609.1 hypothetical protein [Campylobacter helveticus]MCR2063271.1 hypothetical protein [Campylobacter helveticus]MCR2067303.1 hypothetical protein [Campylobacter helveticus]
MKNILKAIVAVCILSLSLSAIEKEEVKDKESKADKIANKLQIRLWIRATS